MNPALLITDIREKEATEPKAPSFPQIKSTTSSGFPEHKKRVRTSAFKQKRQAHQEAQEKKSTAAAPPSNHAAQPPTQTPADEDFETEERRRIDRENNERLASMSPEDIEAARQELFGSMNPATLQMLLKRATLDEPTGTLSFELPEQNPTKDGSRSDEQQGEAVGAPEIRIEDTSEAKPDPEPRKNLRATVEDEEEGGQQETSDSTTKKKVHFESSPGPSDKHTTEPRPEPATRPPPQTDDDSAPPVPPAEHVLHPTEPSISRPHWPRAPQPSTDPPSDSDAAAGGRIDPDDPDFLEKLHQKYFPSLPADPSKLAWMAPLPTAGSPADLESPYHPAQSSVSASAVRFDFRGALVPPRAARAIPVTKGLHHHGEAPEAAGYTIPELARLARSAVPGQRCVAYQTLGRILYRLGAGQFGRPGDPLADGLWALCVEGAVLRSLRDEASLDDGPGRHRSARAFAVEAVWLFEKGGWEERLRRGK